MLNFDEHGNLTPDQPIESDLREVEKMLVFNEHRGRLFGELKLFLEEIYALDIVALEIWLDGSFCNFKAHSSRY